MSVVLAIPDLHVPAQHPDAWEFIAYVMGRHQPDEVICLGDEVDHAALSRFVKNPDLPNAGRELELAIAGLQPLYKMFPKLKVCISNHGARPYRQAEAIGIPAAMMKSYHEFLRAPAGWEWRYEWEIDGVVYVHGDPYTGEAACRRLVDFHGQSVCSGHVHSNAMVRAFPSRNKLLWGASSGCLIDRHHPAFNYARGTAKPWLGVTLVENGVPRLIPMELTSHGRWDRPKAKSAAPALSTPRPRQPRRKR